MKPLAMKSLLVPSLALAMAACATRPADAPQKPPRKAGPDFADLRLDDDRVLAAGAREDATKPLVLHVGLAVVTDVIPLVPDLQEPGVPRFGVEETPAEPEPPAPPVEPEVPAPTR